MHGRLQHTSRNHGSVTATRTQTTRAGERAEFEELTNLCTTTAPHTADVLSCAPSSATSHRCVKSRVLATTRREPRLEPVDPLGLHEATRDGCRPRMHPSAPPTATPLTTRKPPPNASICASAPPTLPHNCSYQPGRLPQYFPTELSPRMLQIT
jgi:hypothetical protein